MFKKLFGLGSKTNEETIVAPLTGAVKNIEEVPDPVFAGRMMGDGVAIDPTEGVVVSPVDGEIVQLFHTKHAIGIKAKKRYRNFNPRWIRNCKNGRRRF